mmetsp:Transcript_13801/g.20475  ORF Transcript_13801/g.20475 Transcript_13801/m.20475 type:complete len:396 (-) Transcript_13801:493-1680(-)
MSASASSISSTSNDKKSTNNENALRRKRLSDSVSWFGCHTPECVLKRISASRRSGSSTSMRAKSSHRSTIQSLNLPHLSKHKCALLFVDISGFTKLSTILDVETLSKSINSYFELIVNEVTEYGGDILKFAGDALFAEWPVNEFDESYQNNHCNNEDGSESKTNHNSNKHNPLSYATQIAAACGASITAKCSDYEVSFGKLGSASQPKSTLNVHCGVAVGEVAGLHVGDQLRREYLILGDPIDQVAKAEGMAHLGELVASVEVVDILSQAGALQFETLQREEWDPHCRDGYRVIANRARNCLSTTILQELSSTKNNKYLQAFSNDTAAYDGTRMNVATLEHYRNLISLYVHPVIRNDELDIYNSLGLNNDPSVYNSAHTSHKQQQQEQQQQRMLH